MRKTAPLADGAGFGADFAKTRASISGSFRDLKVAVYDPLSFVIGCNGTSIGDEVALRASILFERETSVVSDDLALGIQTGPSLADGIATLQFSEAPGWSYQVERTFNSSDSNSGEVVEEIPFLPRSPHDVYIETGEELGFWRMTWETAE